MTRTVSATREEQKETAKQDHGQARKLVSCSLSGRAGGTGPCRRPAGTDSWSRVIELYIR
eukprot:54624-Hanusia_phi.AAC.1